MVSCVRARRIMAGKIFINYRRDDSPGTAGRLHDRLTPTPDGSTLDPWKGTDLTLGNEIDKLANNIALGRDAAGVQYCSDSIHGLFLGEQQALGLLRDYSRTYNEHFDGFVVRKFSGDWVKITGGEVQRL